MKEIVFDMDGVICTQTEGDYDNAIPNKEAIEVINKLYDEGNKIVIYTSRFMGRCNNDIDKVYKEGYEFTINQLKSWDVKFHELVMGKPRCNILVDDRSVFYKDDWKEIYLRIKEKSVKL